MSTKQELIDRVTQEVMKLYSVEPKSNTGGSKPASQERFQKLYAETTEAKGLHQMTALVMICGNSTLKEETIHHFKEIKNTYRTAKVILSENAKPIFQAKSRPFAGHEYLMEQEGLDELHRFDHFYLLNPTVNTLSKIAALQSDNTPSLVAKRALLWGKEVFIALDEIPVYPSGMMDEFNSILEKLTLFGFQWKTKEPLLTKTPAALPALSHSPVSLPVQAIAGDQLRLAAMIDHTLLRADAETKEYEKLCAEAAQYKFASVCVNPGWIPFSKQKLAGSGVMICTVIGFPLGANSTEVKVFETKDAISKGADEIDMVINIGAMKSKNYDLIGKEIKAIVEAAGGKTVKVILETSLLTREEIIVGCKLSKDNGAHFVKTATGFSKGGATVEHIKLMRSAVGPQMGVKASGGVRDTKTALALIEAGATRIGASASVSIVTGKESGKSGY